MIEKGKINILMVVGNTRMGGAQVFILNVLRHINTEKFHIDFAINFFAECNGIEDECRKYRCEFYILPYFKVVNYFSFAHAWRSFLRTHKYDIVYAHSTNSASIFLGIAKNFGLKTIAHSHSAGYRGGMVEQLVKKCFAHKVGKVADYWFACSGKAAERLYGSDYANYRNYYDIPNAIDVDNFKFNHQTRSKIRAQLGLSDSTFLCGHVGTFSTPKNHIFLIDIFAKILIIRPDCQLVCCGAGSLMPDVKKYAKEKGILDKIIFTGVVNNSNEYMIAMDCFVFPSLFEGFPVSILEAQAAGLNIVMSDVIPKEVDLTPLIHRMNLNQNPEAWAHKVLSFKSEDRCSHNKTIACSKYNIISSIKTLEDIFISLV